MSHFSEKLTNAGFVEVGIYIGRRGALQKFPKSGVQSTIAIVVRTQGSRCIESSCPFYTFCSTAMFFIVTRAPIQLIKWIYIYVNIQNLLQSSKVVKL